MARKTEPLPELDPFDGYTIYASNPAYKGESHGVSFSENKREGVSWGRLDPLPKDADEDDVEERMETLRWFLNGEPQRFVVGFEDENRRTGPKYEYRKPYRLVSDAEKAAAAKPAKAEKVPAGAGA